MNRAALLTAGFAHESVAHLALVNLDYRCSRFCFIFLCNNLSRHTSNELSRAMQETESDWTATTGRRLFSPVIGSVGTRAAVKFQALQSGK